MIKFLTRVKPGGFCTDFLMMRNAMFDRSLQMLSDGFSAKFQTRTKLGRICIDFLRMKKAMCG